MHRRFVRFLLLIVALATIASACTSGGVGGGGGQAPVIPTSGGGSYRPPPPPLPGEFHRLDTLEVGPFYSPGNESIRISRTGRFVYWVTDTQDNPTRLMLADLSTGQTEVVFESNGGIQLSNAIPRVGDEAKVYFNGSAPCNTGCTWSPTEGLYSIPALPPPGCPAVLWPEEDTVILQCYDALHFVFTDRVAYNLVTGQFSLPGPEQQPSLAGLNLRMTSTNGRYSLYTSDIFAAPVAKVKDNTTQVVTDVPVTGHPQSLMAFNTWWIFGALTFINWHGVKDDGVVVYDRIVFQQTLRSQQIRLYDVVNNTDSMLPGYDAVKLWAFGGGDWMIDYDYWNEIGRNAQAEGRELETYLEMSNKTDPSQRYGLPDEAFVQAILPDGQVLVTSLTPLNPGDPPGLGIYWHEAPA